MTRIALSGMVLCALLAGCSSDGELQRVGRATLSDALRAAPVSGDPVPAYQRLPAHPAMGARRESGGAEVILRRRDRSADGVETWIAPDGSGFSFRDGVLIGTRGLGDDLMAADVTDLRARLADGQDGRSERFHSYLTGEGQIEVRSYVCDLTHVLQPRPGLRETCAGVSDSFTNTYFTPPGPTTDRTTDRTRAEAPARSVETSRQYVSAATGALRFRNLD
ncbi:YjbF family lipoprotein [Pseudooceanicola sediminis]|uniref:YjbF family lipoprotein n=1 Tax=Pseudooceanicola sediminis TaxID=2211117 RepID=UPI0013146A0C|nr:YjbF family lipoprotein [Pseudooceanicola sediminis]